MTKYILLVSLVSFQVPAKLLNKIAGVVNDKIYTLSDLKDIEGKIDARKEIAGFVYSKENYNLEDVFLHLRNKYIVKDTLSEQGIIITDERVEEQIEETKKRLGIDHSVLVKSLKDRGLSYEEYFELTREITEFNVFNRNIIAPLVNITDQELKNLFYEKSQQKNTFNFTYDIEDFSVPTSSVSQTKLSELKKQLAKFKTNKVKQGDLKKFNIVNIGKVAGDDLPSNIKAALKATDKGNFSEPIERGGSYHFFYVKDKELAESQAFKRAKNALYAQLFMRRSQQITDDWFEREASNYYVLKNI